MNPPSVYELTMPNIQRINSKTAIVQSIGTPFLNLSNRLPRRSVERARQGSLSGENPIQYAISLYGEGRRTILNRFGRFHFAPHRGLDRPLNVSPVSA